MELERRMEIRGDVPIPGPHTCEAVNLGALKTRYRGERGTAAAGH